MNKALYILPLLAVLGMISAHDAAAEKTIQERIDRLQAKIDVLEKRIADADPVRDAKRIDKWEAKIDKHEQRIAELRERMGPSDTETPEDSGTETQAYAEIRQAPGEPTSARQAGVPPTVISATLDLDTGILEIVFSEAIDFDKVSLDGILLGDFSLAGMTFDSSAPDSETMQLDAPQIYLDVITDMDNPALRFTGSSVIDIDGDGIQYQTVPITVTNAPEETPTEETPTEETPTEETPTEETPTEETPTEETPVEETPDNLQMIATVTITADGRFVEDAGTAEIPHGDVMAFTVTFVNEHSLAHTVLADLISWDFEHQRKDIPLATGASTTVTYTIQGDAPRIGTDNENANVYLVFGVENIEDTPEHEPDTITGDHAIKIRITEPAS